MARSKDRKVSGGKRGGVQEVQKGKKRSSAHPVSKPTVVQKPLTRKGRSRLTENEFFDLDMMPPASDSDSDEMSAKDPFEPPDNGYHATAFTPFRKMVFSEDQEGRDSPWKEDDNGDDAPDDDDDHGNDEPGEEEEGEILENETSGNGRNTASPAPPTNKVPTMPGEGPPTSTPDTADAPAALLLPEHIKMGQDEEEVDEQDEEDAEEVEHDMTGIAFVDDNRAAGLVRYYDPQATDDFFASADLSRVCRNCKKPGHTERECTTLICLRCGAEGHEKNDCKYASMCRYCGQTGHMSAACPQRREEARERGGGCRLCGSRTHSTTGCELVWRSYVYLWGSDRTKALDERRSTSSWRKEAVGGDPAAMFCYNCAEEGHMGDDCRRPFVARAHTPYQTAFSAQIARRGPYGGDLGKGRSNGAGGGWSHDLPGVDGGFAAFAGADAGRKSREKQRERERERDRERGRERDRDSGRADRADAWYSRNAVRTEPRYSDKPLIRFGAMSAPGGGSGRGNDRSNWRVGEAELEEREWRASGAGGGRVDTWGEEMDRELRDARREQTHSQGSGRSLLARMQDDRPRAGPVRGGPGGGAHSGGGGAYGRGGSRGGGQSSARGGSGRGGRGASRPRGRGQRYTGGY